MLDPTKWCWVQSVKKTDDQLLTGTHLNLQGHVWVVAQDGFHIGAKHSRELVECVHLARVYDQVVPGRKNKSPPDESFWSSNIGLKPT